MRWLEIAAACAALLNTPAAAQALTDPTDALEGMWVSETVYSAALSGELSVRRVGDAWQASIAGEHAKSAVDGGAVRLAFGVHGRFRGALARSGAIDGFWLRPSGETEDRADPGGSGQPFATPLVLRRVARNEWRGEVAPLDDRFTNGRIGRVTSASTRTRWRARCRGSSIRTPLRVRRRSCIRC